MKQKFLLITLIIFAALSNGFAQPLAGKKICVDPGHGGHDPANDRYIPATGFWESDANWDKALYLKPILQNLGATVILTRQGNNDSDDLLLSDRAAIANNNNVDFFNSIHSNGWQGTSNYTLMLFRGYDNAPVHAQAKEMGAIMANQIYQVNRTTGQFNRGDWSFYPDWGTSGLGVLRPLNMPGVLSEGSFHDYIPESWRLMNTHYRLHEAWAIARSYVTLYNTGPLAFGAIAGILRDPLNNVSYYYLPSTNDQKKPINHIQVTLTPGNLVYNGDDKNNGFFVFDSLAPGEYKLYFQAEDFALDSATVTVIANKTVFVDKNLNEAPNYNAPTVTAYSPDSAGTNIGLYTPIVIDFDIRMNTALTQSAFSIQPTMSGTFTWENNNKRMIFTPSPRWDPASSYSVSVSTNAQSHFGVSLQQPVNFSFDTRIKLNLLSAYPDSGRQNVSTTVLLTYVFDAPINLSSLGGNVQFLNEAGNSVAINLNQSAITEGKLIFEPQAPLASNATYKVVIKEGLKDNDNLTFGELKEFVFTTEAEAYVSGIVLDPLETIGQWKDPNFSGSTVGTDPDLTTFTIVSDRKKSGTYSGKINYVFTGNTGGVCRTFNGTKPSVGSAGDTKAGVWVFGDNSNNILEYWFYYNTSTNSIARIDTLNWTGWKMKYIPLSQVTGTGDKLFHSVVVVQTPEGNKNSAIYIDDLQTSVVTSVEEIPQSGIMPDEYALSQNYPNPFNPTTNIRFSLPSNGHTSLKVYDMLGREVRTLISEEMPAGYYEINFDAHNLSSGVYFYTLTSGNFTSSNKMILLK